MGLGLFQIWLGWCRVGVGSAYAGAHTHKCKHSALALSHWLQRSKAQADHVVTSTVRINATARAFAHTVRLGHHPSFETRHPSIPASSDKATGGACFPARHATSPAAPTLPGVSMALEQWLSMQSLEVHWKTSGVRVVEKLGLGGALASWPHNLMPSLPRTWMRGTARTTTSF